MRRWFFLFSVMATVGWLFGCDTSGDDNGNPDTAAPQDQAAPNDTTVPTDHAAPTDHAEPVDIVPDTAADLSAPDQASADSTPLDVTQPEQVPPVDTTEPVDPLLVGDSACLGQWQAPAAPDPVVFGGEIVELISENPIENIAVEFHAVADDTLLAQTATDADGLYSISAGAAAGFPFDAFYSKLSGTNMVDTYGFNNKVLGVADLAADFDLTVVGQTSYNTLKSIIEMGGATINPELGIVSGRLVDCAGQSIGGGMVTLDPAPEGALVYYRQSTFQFDPAAPGVGTNPDPDLGSFAIINVPAGSYTVTVWGRMEGQTKAQQLLSAPVKAIGGAISIQRIYLK